MTLRKKGIRVYHFPLFEGLSEYPYQSWPIPPTTSIQDCLSSVAQSHPFTEHGSLSLFLLCHHSSHHPQNLSSCGPSILLHGLSQPSVVFSSSTQGWPCLDSLRHSAVVMELPHDSFLSIFPARFFSATGRLFVFKWATEHLCNKASVGFPEFPACLLFKKVSS